MVNESGVRLDVAAVERVAPDSMGLTWVLNRHGTSSPSRSEMDADADATMTSEVVHVNQGSAARRTQSLGARSRRSLDPDVIGEDPNLPGTRPWGRDCPPRTRPRWSWVSPGSPSTS
jgi:hypothetical protein